ncbi:AzlC family ABC transporter permease [Gephyromycinifex aptenodytis]|uniref:AzlC family ABC transporter permease n=1 Tax=Gephyromycinifex aptenodytis TaxID=2716227 RepID=UPI001445A582|nr:AzlC family ABC transporter permease [Gephyromycinifex aptenodytis]
MTPATRMGLSIGVATGLYGLSFGALGVAAGLSIAQTCALSLLMFTGGSQFALVGVISGGGTWPSAITAASLLGVRNAVYGVQLNELLRPRGSGRLLMAHLTIDESTATAVSQDEPADQRRGFWVAGLAVFVFWNLATFIGALAGESLGDPKAWGLDGAAVAAFLGLLWPRLRGRSAFEVAALCAGATLVATPFVPPGIPIILAGAIAVLVSWLRHRRDVATARVTA